MFYDYADINIDSLPDDIRERLTKGIYFEGEALVLSEIILTM